jgi:hypothetical protein
MPSSLAVLHMGQTYLGSDTELAPGTIAEHGEFVQVQIQGIWERAGGSEGKRVSGSL